MYGIHRRFIKKSLLILSLLTSLTLSSCTFYKILIHNFSEVDDYELFPSKELTVSDSPFHFAEKFSPSKVPDRIKIGKKSFIGLNHFLELQNTLAFLIIKNDTLIYEKYFNEHSESSISQSFSMAKSITSILIGCAIDDGLIKSVDQPVTDYVPELKSNGYDKVKIKHLLQMTSGMDYTESDNPFGLHPHFYYGPDLEEKLINLKLKETPGKRFEYRSGENQLLGLILKRALKTKSITEYTQEKLWTPLGMEYAGLWSTDDKGFEKTFCCLSACAKDFAKIGRLYLNKGNWNGNQIVSPRWVEESTKVDTTEGSVWYYQYQWWLVRKDHGDFCADGHLGQFIYVNPKKQMIIVRLGKALGDINSSEWKSLFVYLSEEVR